jgi:hypothetical protein
MRTLKDGILLVRRRGFVSTLRVGYCVQLPAKAVFPGPMVPPMLVYTVVRRSPWHVWLKP